MTNTRPSLRNLLPLAVLCLAAVGCQKKDETIKIGLAGVQTGPDGQIGSTMFHGSEIAIEEWNARGGVLGKKIEVVGRDDEGKPKQAVAVAQELVSAGVHAVIGHFNSGCTKAASPIYQQAGIVEITPGSTNPEVTERGFEALFRICGRDDQQGQIGALFARETLKVEKVAILHNKTPYGQGLADEFKKTFEGKGGSVVLYQGVGEEEADFRAVVSAIKKAGARAVFWGGMYGQAGILYNQLRQGGVPGPFLGGDGSIVKEMINTVGANADSVYLTFGPDYKKVPGAQDFLKKYRAKYGEEGPYSVYGYDAANVLLESMKIAGTTEAGKVAAAMRSKTFETAMGPVAFDAKGDLKKSNYVIWTIRDGEFVVRD